MSRTTLSSVPLLHGQEVFTSSATQMETIGSYAETSDGRGYRYSLVGAVSTVAGKVYQGTALDATNLQPSGGLGVAAQAIGDTTITVSTSTTVAANLLANGYVSVNVTPGQGYIYSIKGNTVTAGATGLVITLSDPLLVALTTSSKIIVAQNTYSGIVIEPGTPTAAIAGVPNTIITNAQYGWTQTRGACSVLFTGTGVAGKAVGSLSGGTSGSAAPAIAATNILGYHMATGITAEYALIHLVIG